MLRLVIVPRGCFSDRVQRINQLTVMAFKEKSAKEVVLLILHSAGFIEKEDPGTTYSACSSLDRSQIKPSKSREGDEKAKRLC